MSRFPAKHVTLVAVVTALTLAACAKDETPTPEQMPPAGAPGDISAIQNEYMSIQQRLGPLQQKAMQDSTLQAEFEAIGDMVESQMFVVEPETGNQRDRITAIQGEMREMGPDGDDEKMQDLMEEGTSLQKKLQQTQTTVLAQDSVSARMKEFQDKVIAKMTELDPETPKLVERLNALAEQIRAGAHPPMASGTNPPAGGEE